MEYGVILSTQHGEVSWYSEDSGLPADGLCTSLGHSYSSISNGDGNG